MINKPPEALTVEELHRLLVEKRWEARQIRLERFRRTGRIIEPFAEGEFLDKQAARTGEAARLVKSARQVWMDRVMAGVETLSILILFGLMLNGASLLRRFNQEVAVALQQPALEPTPLISAVVLPEGHTPPNAPGGAQPNEAEIPEHLRPLVQSLANLPVPTPGSRQAVRIQIPVINVDAPVVQGDGWEQLKLGVAQHAGTPDPGENGNLVLSGHNDVFGEVFRYLERLMPGDVVIVFTVQRQYTYVITGTRIVEPTRVEVMDPTPNPTLTLISCHPYLVDNHRIVVSAVLQSP
ncbi:MAG: sortase [Anaerolineales bacterium]|nr:sortase [Anaerolineales bacterium]